MLKLKLLKFIGQLWIIIIQLLGFWPYYFDPSCDKFRTNFIFLLYPLIVFISVMISFIYFTEAFMDNRLSEKVLNKTAFFFGQLFSFIWLVIFLTTYIRQYFNHENVKVLLLNGYELYKRLQISILSKRVCVGLTRLLIHFIFKMFIINFMIIFVNLELLFEIYNPKLQLNFFVLLGSQVPFVMMNIIPTFFYGCILVISHVFKLINFEIQDIIKEANRIDITNDKHSFLQMKKFCELSDNLDELADLHTKLCEIINQLCCNCSIHMLGWMVNLFQLFTYKTFVQYIVVMAYFRNFGNVIDIPRMVVYNLLHIVLMLIELIMMVFNCCDSLNKVIFTNFGVIY